MLDEAKKKKPYNSVTYTTGDIQKNIDHFNKALNGGKDVKTDGILNGTFKNSSAEAACKTAGTFAAASPDGASSVSLGGGESSGGGMAESLDNRASEDIIKLVRDADKETKQVDFENDGGVFERKNGYDIALKQRTYGWDVDKLINNLKAAFKNLGKDVEVEQYGLNCILIDFKVEESLNEGYEDLVGKTIKIISIGDDPAADRYEGKTGVVKEAKVDPWGDTQLWGTWGGIAIYPEHDVFEVIENESLTEQKIYVSKWNEQVNIPDHIKVLDKNTIEAALEKLEPEEEFLVGYVTPIRFYTELDDKFDLVKCTELLGYTGVDYIEARANEINKDERVQVSKDAIALGSKNGVHLDRNPLAKMQGDFSARYASTNKTVLQNNGNTLLFYPKVGTTPKVTYYLDLHNGNGFRKINRDLLERMILSRIQEIADQLKYSRWTDQKLADKIQKQLDSDAATISAKVLDKETSAETRSKLSNGMVAKPPVRALYTNQIYYLSTQYDELGHFLTEDVELQEAGGKKGRKVTRYYIKPHHIWCAKKVDILNALIDNPNEDCTIYTLINLDDNKDVTKLSSNDVIYYYEDGILYDKNHVKVMDYDLAVKHEEERKKINVNTAPDSQIEKVYHDRITGSMSEEVELNHELDLNFEDINVYGERLHEGKVINDVCCICGEKIEGYGNNPEPYMGAENGKCCDACNLKFVIPERLAQINDNEE